MADRHALKVIPGGAVESLTADAQWWALALDQAARLVKTGFLPAEINTPEKAVAVMMKGRELRVPPMYSLSNIAIVKGKPTCSAELMLALIYRDHGDNAIVVTESTPQRCVVDYRRPNWPKAQTFTFSIEDATRAGLASGATWKSYPQAMLRARCISAVARMAFPDSISGMYTPEELGAAVSVTDDGVIEVQSSATGSVKWETIPHDAETGEIIDAAPVEPTPAPRVNQAYLARLHALGSDKDLSHDDLSNWAKRLYAVDSMRELTVEQAKDFAEKIKSLIIPEPSDAPPAGMENEEESARLAALIDAAPGQPGNDKHTF